MTTETREQLSAYAHDAWSGWMTYQFANSTRNADGTYTIPRELVERWERQAATPYERLPEHEKESDRTEADRMLAIVFGDAPHIPIIVAAMIQAYNENPRGEYYMTLTPAKLLVMLRQNVSEVGLAIYYDNDVLPKCGDVANYAGFIARLCASLDTSAKELSAIADKDGSYERDE